MFIVSLAVIVLLLPVHAFFSTWLGTLIGPLLVWKSWKELLLGVLIVPVLVYCCLRPDITRLLWSRTVNKVVIAYMVLTLLLAPFSHASWGAIAAGLLIDLRFFACFILAQLILASGNPWVAKLKARIPDWLLWTMIGLSIVAILQVSVMPKDFLTNFGYNKYTTIAPYATVDNKPNVLRAFATMRGPNTLGAYLLIPLAAAFYFVCKRQRLAISATALGLGLLALLLTGSRSAWIGMAAMFMLILLYILPQQWLALWTKRLAIPATLGLSLLLWAAVSVPAIRLAVFHSSAQDVNPALLAGSSDAHWQATFQGIAYIAAHPLGTGPGSAGPASFYNTKAAPLISEDYYVQIGEEVGILGLLLFVLINVLVAKDLLKAKEPIALLLFASFIGLSIINIFLHGWADDPTAMTWWTLAGLVIYNRSDSGFASAKHRHTSAREISRRAS